MFSLSEEDEKREVVDQGELAGAKYPWQRVRSTLRSVPSGRLVLRLDDGPTSKIWADRMRWSLADKLPAAFGYIEQAAAAAIERRTQQEARRRERRQAWEVAVQQAKLAYVSDLNRNRLDHQARPGRESRRHSPLR